MRRSADSLREYVITDISSERRARHRSGGLVDAPQRFQDTTEPANLYVVNADGTGLQQLTHFGGGETRATQPRVAPDGSGITFTQVDGAGFGTRTLAFIAIDGTGQRSLTTDPMAGTHPQLRPLPVD